MERRRLWLISPSGSAFPKEGEERHLGIAWALLGYPLFNDVKEKFLHQSLVKNVKENIVQAIGNRVQDYCNRE